MSTLIRGGLGALPANQGSSQLVRTSTGNLYAVLTVSNRVQVYKSTNNGATWAEVDYPHAPSGNSTTPAAAAAIDGNDTIHIVYKDPASNSNRYVQFITSSDVFGSSEVVNSPPTAVPTTIAIAVDSNNIPHIASSGAGASPQELYFNRIGKSGGLWNAVTLGVNSGSFADIQIDNNNVPQISFDSASNGLIPFIGNQNKAISFTTGPTLNSTAALGASLTLDSLGNTWVANSARGGNLVRLWRHLKTDAWSVWGPVIDNGNTGVNVSVAANGTDIYIFYERSAGGIAYDKYDSINKKWLGEQIIQPDTPSIRWHNPFVKWSNYFDNGFTGANNTNSNTIEYLFDNGNYVFYDRLITAQIAVGLAAITFKSNAAATTTSTSSTSSSTSTSTSASTSSTSTSLSTSSTSASTSLSTSTSSTSASTSTSRSTSTSSTSASTSLSTSSTSASISTSSTSASTSLSTSSTSSSTSVSSTSSSISTSSTSTSATGTTTSTSSTSASMSTSVSSTSSSTSRSTSTSSTSASTSVSTSTSSTSASTSISTSSTSHSTSTSFSTSSTSTSISASTSISTSSTSISASTSISTSSTSQSTSTSTSTTVSITTSTSSTSVSTSTTTILIDHSTTPRPTLPVPGMHFGVITAIPAPRSAKSDIPTGVIGIDHIRPTVRLISPVPKIRHNR